MCNLVTEIIGQLVHLTPYSMPHTLRYNIFFLSFLYQHAKFYESKNSFETKFGNHDGEDTELTR